MSTTIRIHDNGAQPDAMMIGHMRTTPPTNQTVRETSNRSKKPCWPIEGTIETGGGRTTRPVSWLDSWKVQEFRGKCARKCILGGIRLKKVVLRFCKPKIAKMKLKNETDCIENILFFARSGFWIKTLILQTENKGLGASSFWWKRTNIINVIKWQI